MLEVIKRDRRARRAIATGLTVARQVAKRRDTSLHVTSIDGPRLSGNDHFRQLNAVIAAAAVQGILRHQQ